MQPTKRAKIKRWLRGQFKLEFAAAVPPFVHYPRKLVEAPHTHKVCACYVLENVARNGLIWSKPLQTWWPNYHRQLLFMQEASLSLSAGVQPAASARRALYVLLALILFRLAAYLRRRRHGILCCARLWILNTHTQHTPRRRNYILEFASRPAPFVLYSKL